jgi:hypothetical protein
MPFDRGKWLMAVDRMALALKWSMSPNALGEVASAPTAMSSRGRFMVLIMAIQAASGFMSYCLSAVTREVAPRVDALLISKDFHFFR